MNLSHALYYEQYENEVIKNNIQKYSSWYINIRIFRFIKWHRKLLIIWHSI